MRAVEAAMRLGWFLPCATLCFVLKESPERMYANFVPIFDDVFVGLSRAGRDLTDLSVETHFGDTNSLNLGVLISEKKHAEHSEEGVLKAVAAPKSTKKQKEFIPSPVDEMAERIGKSLGKFGRQWQNHLNVGGQVEGEPDVLLRGDVQQAAEFVVRASQAVVSEGPREIATHHAVSHNGAAALQTDIIDVSTFPTLTKQSQSPIPYKELEQTTEATLESEGNKNFKAIRANNRPPKKPPVVLTHQIERGTGKVILPHYKTSHHDRLRPERKMSQSRLRDLHPPQNRHRLPPPSAPLAPPSPQELARHANLWLLEMARAGNKHKAKATASVASFGIATRSTTIETTTTTKTTATATSLKMEVDELRNIPDLFETLPKPSHLRDHSNRAEQLVTSETREITYTSSSPRVPFSADMNPTTGLMGNELGLVDTLFRDDVANVGLEEKVESEEGDTMIVHVPENTARATRLVGRSNQSLAHDYREDLGVVAREIHPNNGLIYSPSGDEVEDHLDFEDSTRNYNQLVETLYRAPVESPTTTPQPIHPLIVYGTQMNRDSERRRAKKGKSIDDFVPSMRISNTVNPGDAIFYSNRPLSDSEYSRAVEVGSKFHAPNNLIPVDNPVAKKTLGKDDEDAGGFRSPRRSDYNVKRKFTGSGDEEKPIIFPKEENKKINFKPSTQIRKFYHSSEDKFSPMDNDINTLLLTATARADAITRPSVKFTSTTAKTTASTTKTPSKHEGLAGNPRWPKSKSQPQRRKKLGGNLVTHSKSGADYFRVASSIPKVAHTSHTRPRHHETVDEEDTASALNVIPPPPSKLLPPPKKSAIAKTAQKELFDGAGGGRLIDREGLLKALMKARDRGGLGTRASSAAESGAWSGGPTLTSRLQLPQLPTSLALLTKHPLVPENLMRYVDKGFKMVTKWLPGGLAFLGPERQFYLQ